MLRGHERYGIERRTPPHRPRRVLPDKSGALRPRPQPTALKVRKLLGNPSWFAPR